MIYLLFLEIGPLSPALYHLAYFSQGFLAGAAAAGLAAGVLAAGAAKLPSAGS